jgi:hypothetical protein
MRAAFTPPQAPLGLLNSCERNAACSRRDRHLEHYRTSTRATLRRVARSVRTAIASPPSRSWRGTLWPASRVASQPNLALNRCARNVLFARAWLSRGSVGIPSLAKVRLPWGTATARFEPASKCLGRLLQRCPRRPQRGRLAGCRDRTCAGLLTCSRGDVAPPGTFPCCWPALEVAMRFGYCVHRVLGVVWQKFFGG